MELREDPVSPTARDERQDDVPLGDGEVLDDVVAGARCGEHDVDATFVCQRCGTFGCAKCAFAIGRERSTCVSCAAHGLGRPIAWERRRELGWWNAFWKTIGEVSRSPTRFYRTPTTTENALSAVGFGVISWTIGLALTYLLVGLLYAIGGGVLTTQGPELEQVGWTAVGFGGVMAVGSPVLAAIMGPANALIALVFSAAMAHGFLAIFKRTKGGFEDSLRAICYANAPYIWSFVPVLGSLTWFWVIGLEVIGLREIHKCGTDWAVGAAVIYRVVLTVVGVTLYVLMVLGMLAILLGSEPPPPPS